MRRALTGPLSFGLSKAIASPEGVGVPAWVLSGAALDLDFAEVQGYNSLDRSKLTPDSILTYTSPSPKLVYGDDGVLRYAPHNLLTYSARQFDNAAWSKTRGTVARIQFSCIDCTPDRCDSITADKMVETRIECLSFCGHLQRQKLLALPQVYGTRGPYTSKRRNAAFGFRPPQRVVYINSVFPSILRPSRGLLKALFGYFVYDAGIIDGGPSNANCCRFAYREQVTLLRSTGDRLVKAAKTWRRGIWSLSVGSTTVFMV